MQPGNEKIQAELTSKFQDKDVNFLYITAFLISSSSERKFRKSYYCHYGVGIRVSVAVLIGCFS